MVSKPTVLVVDDEPLIAAMVEMTLCDAGFEVQMAADAVEAACMIAKLHDRLLALVTDIPLGAGPTGWAVAAGARKIIPDLPVVYMTGDSAAAWATSAVPGSILIPKPFVGAQVLAAVTELMGQRLQPLRTSPDPPAEPVRTEADGNSVLSRP